MLAPELIQKIKQIQLKAGHLATATMAGDYVTAFKGKGMEFDEVREYTPGDDVRAIDWNVTARMNHPFVKIFREEREMTLMLLVDVSPSQGFGSTGRAKQDVAAELAAILAYLAIRSHDRVGLLLFSDHVEQFIAPRRGRAHVWRIIRAVLTHEGRGRATDLVGALDYWAQVAHGKSLVFLISDFWATGFESRLRQAARRHELVCAEVVDPRERAWPDLGLVELCAAETGERYVVDTSRKAVREALSARARERSESLRRLALGAQADYLAIDTAEETVEPLKRFLRGRGERRRR